MPERWPARVRALRLPIRTPRLELVLPSRRHVEAYPPLMDDPEIDRWTLRVPKPYRRKHAAAFVARARRRYRRGTGLSLTIEERGRGRVVGGIALVFARDPQRSEAEIGYWIAREARGHGFASEAVQALAEVAFRRLRLHRLTAGVFEGNLASRKVLERCGFRFEGAQRAAIRKHGIWRTDWCFARLADETGPRTGRPRTGRPAARRTSGRRRSARSPRARVGRAA
jgi:RimJ/RimL family protein N-acetyltransferase